MTPAAAIQRAEIADVVIDEVGPTVHWDRDWERFDYPPPEVQVALFRIAQESLANVVKHAQATEVVVTLGLAKDKIHLRIRDNGKGFAVKQQRAAAEKNRLGLLGMQERVRLVNGRFLVRSAPGFGTTVTVEIPLATGSQLVATDAIPLARNEGSRAC